MKKISFILLLIIFTGSGAAVDNITLEMSFSPSNVIIDGQTVSGTTTVTDFDNPFISSDQPVGLIGYTNNAIELRYVESPRERFEIVSSGQSADFLVPFTQGGYESLTDRENEIADNTFLNLLPPSFAFEQIDPLTSVIYDFPYPVTNIVGPQTGIETVIIRNRLDSDNETQFVLRTE